MPNMLRAGLQSVSLLASAPWGPEGLASVQIRAVDQAYLQMRSAVSDPHSPWYNMFEPQEHAPREDSRLFREEDMSSWIIFSVVFLVLVFLDIKVMHRQQGAMSFNRAMLYTCFWLVCAALFCAYIYKSRGSAAAIDWGTGYILEWMLSVDNIFVFHRIFAIFKTPDDQKHAPLFWGIMGAIFFRMALFCIEQALMHHIHWMHFVFGAFLIYTGVKTVACDDDEEGDEPSPLFQRISTWLAYVDIYDDRGKGFFMMVPVDKRTGEVLMSMPNSRSATPTLKKGEDESHPASKVHSASQSPHVPVTDIHVSRSCTVEEENIVWRCKGTRLLLVVVCLEVTDVIFAVDSVSAIVAQIPDLYLSYTACIFAMLGLRALFFVIDELVRLFSLLSYGVGAILVFIGIKLMLKDWIHVPAPIVCIILVSTLAFSIVASVVWEGIKERREKREEQARQEAEPEARAVATA